MRWLVLKVREVATPHPGELAALPCLPDLTANVNSADSVLFVCTGVAELCARSTEAPGLPEVPDFKEPRVLFTLRFGLTCLSFRHHSLNPESLIGLVRASEKGNCRKRI